MKRWTGLLLLLLLPLTMAPRTSMNPEGGALAMTGVISRTTVRPGSAVTFVLQARNVSDAVLERAHVDILIGWEGKSDTVKLAASQACTVTHGEGGFVASCPLGALDPDEQATVRVTARPLVGGMLSFQAVDESGLAPRPAEKVIEVSVRGRG